MGTIDIRYLFKLPDNKHETIELYLDDKSLLLINDIPANLPSWTDLDFHQCPNCALTIDRHPKCPVAIHFVRLLSVFDGLMSYEKIPVEIITHQRITFQNISAQKAVSSVMGLIIATSGCPHTIFFRPMARFHLPFADSYETTYRATSMYLLAQYFLHKEGRNIDMEFEGLKKIYSDIQMIDKAMFNRLLAISDKDVAINAVAILDALANLVPMAIEESLDEIRTLFDPYVNQ